MGEVIVFSLAGTPDELLQDAIGKLERVLILGVTKEGDEFEAHSDAPMLHHWDLQLAAYRLLKAHDEE